MLSCSAQALASVRPRGILPPDTKFITLSFGPTLEVASVAGTQFMIRRRSGCTPYARRDVPWVLKELHPEHPLLACAGFRNYVSVPDVVLYAASIRAMFGGSSFDDAEAVASDDYLAQLNLVPPWCLVGRLCSVRSCILLPIS